MWFFISYVQDFAAADEKCPASVREGFSMIDELAGQGDSGEPKILHVFCVRYLI